MSPGVASEILTSSKTRTKEDDLRAMHDDPALFATRCLEHHFFLPLADVHLRIFRAVFSRNPFVVVIVPRKHGKTTCVNVAYPLYNICYRKEQYIMLISESGPEARSNLRTLKYELGTNDVIHHYFGRLQTERVVDQYGKWNEDLAKTSTGIWLAAKGSLAQIRGNKQIASPPTLIIVDDPQSQKSTLTRQTLEKSDNWFENEVVFAKAEKYQKPGSKFYGAGKVRLVGTVVHSDCIVLNKNKDSRFKKVFMKAIEVDENGKEYSIWPEMWSLDKLYKEKADYAKNNKLRNWMQERMNVAMSDDERSFRVEDLKFWDEVESSFQLINEQPCLVFDKSLDGATDGFHAI